MVRYFADLPPLDDHGERMFQSDSRRGIVLLRPPYDGLDVVSYEIVIKCFAGNTLMPDDYAWREFSPCQGIDVTYYFHREDGMYSLMGTFVTSTELTRIEYTVENFRHESVLHRVYDNLDMGPIEPFRFRSDFPDQDYDETDNFYVIIKLDLLRNYTDFLE